MPETAKEINVPPMERTKKKRKSNISLPDTTGNTELQKNPTLERRNTLSEENGNVRAKKTVKAPMTATIPEDDTTQETLVDFRIESERKRLDRQSSSVSRISMTSIKSKTSKLSYDNKAYDSKSDEITKTSRAPSIHSLEVYQEQYCCCSRRTKCERVLLVTVSILAIIIIVLVIVVAVLAGHGSVKRVLGIK